MPWRSFARFLSITLTIVIGPFSLFAQQLSVTRLDSTKISPSEIDAVVVRLMEQAHVTGSRPHHRA
jgi:hypothetical protein